MIKEKRNMSQEDEEVQELDLEEQYYYDDEDNCNNEKENDSNQQSEVPSYELIYNNETIDDTKEPLSNVIGHTKQKEELLAVIKWFKNSKELKEKGVSIPKGVILFGKPGNGKSLFIKEMIRYVKAPVFIFKGDQNNVVKGIDEVFSKAREIGHAIIVIDEIDLLINQERRVMRALQENLDGVESNDDILVLAATNFLQEIPPALTRNGRLEKLIHIPFPSEEEAVELLKQNFDKFNISLPDDFDDEEMGLALSGISCAGIKAVVNDVVLRNGFENITLEMIDDSICNITRQIKDATPKENLDVAMHEAGHAVVAYQFKEYFKVNRLSLNGPSGEFTVKEIERDFWPYKKVIANIMISIAGNIAQKVVCNQGSFGCEDDLEKARQLAFRINSKSGFKSVSHTIANYGRPFRPESEFAKLKAENKASRLLRKLERKVFKIIRTNKDKINKLGNALYKNGHLKSAEIIEILG